MSAKAFRSGVVFLVALLRLLPVFLGFMSVSALADQQTGRWGDQGDGTFRNPVIAADYSDPDPIRVGDDYYLAASTFETSPGGAILHSRDLVNWESVGAAIPDPGRLGDEFTWRRMSRYGGGVYAPSLRYHDGKFWVFVNCFSGEGFLVCTATAPAGPWIVTQMKDKHGKPLRTSRWTDPCPFWDDDGKAYLAASRPGGKWYSYLFQMSPDGTQLLDADVDHLNQKDIVYRYPDGGTLFSPNHSSEGNKIYKRNGWYYLVHIEFTSQGQGQGTYIYRSKNLYGTKADGTPGGPGDPGRYEVLTFAIVSGGSQDLPGQGGFVDTPDGRWFYLGQFNRCGSDGRTPCLVPVTWIDDWPVVGTDIDRQALRGRFAWHLPKPIAGQPIALPQGSDDFSAATLHPRWQWSHAPRADKWSLTERPGYLRLHAFPPAGNGGFFKIGNVINQRHLRSDSTTVTARLELGGMVDGQEAGLVRFDGGKSHATLALVRHDGVFAFKYEETGQPPVLAGDWLPSGTDVVWVRSTVGLDDRNAYSYSLDGETFIPFGGTYKLRMGNYRGNMIGLYTVNPVGEAGYLDIDWFRYEVQNR